MFLDAGGKMTEVVHGQKPQRYLAIFCKDFGHDGNGQCETPNLRSVDEIQSPQRSTSQSPCVFDCDRKSSTKSFPLPLCLVQHVSFANRTSWGGKSFNPVPVCRIATVRKGHGKKIVSEWEWDLHAKIGSPFRAQANKWYLHFKFIRFQWTK